MNVAGQIYRKPRILNGQNQCFPVDFPLDQAILFAPVMLRRQGIGGHEGQKGYCQVSFAHGNSHCPCLLLRQHCSSLSTESSGEWRSPIGNNTWLNNGLEVGRESRHSTCVVLVCVIVLLSVFRAFLNLNSVVILSANKWRIGWQSLYN